MFTRSFVFSLTRSLHSNEVSNQIQNLCSAAGAVISIVIQFCFFFGKLCLFFHLNFTLSRGYFFLFCFVSSHSINTHELRGDFVVDGGAISFVLRLSAHFTKLTLHKQTELLFVQLVHSLFLLVCSFAYVLAQHSDCVCISFFFT